MKTPKWVIDYYKCLIGTVITDITYDHEMNAPVLRVRRGGELFLLVPLADPEGNGPGHLEVVKVGK